MLKRCFPLHSGAFRALVASAATRGAFRALTRDAVRATPSPAFAAAARCMSAQSSAPASPPPLKSNSASPPPPPPPPPAPKAAEERAKSPPPPPPPPPHREPIAEEAARRAPKAGRLWTVLGLAALGACVGAARGDARAWRALSGGNSDAATAVAATHTLRVCVLIFHLFLHYVVAEQKLRNVLSKISSADARRVREGLTGLQALFFYRERSFAGVSDMPRGVEDLYEAGAIEALVSAIERETVGGELKAVALAALIRLARALPEARADVSNAATGAVISVLNSQPSSSLAWQRACALVAELADDVDARDTLARDAALVHTLSLLRAKHNELDAVAQLLLGRLTVQLSATSHGRALLGLSDEEGAALSDAWSSTQSDAAAAALQSVAPEDDLSTKRSLLEANNLVQSLPFVFGGFLYGRARWTLRMWSAGTPLRGRALLRFAAQKSKVGKCLLALVLLDVGFSTARQRWSSLRHYVPEALEAATPSGERTHALVAPVTQATAIALAWLTFQRFQHFMVLPTALYLLFVHEDALEQHETLRSLRAEFYRRFLSVQ